MELFTPQIPSDQQNKIFKLLLEDAFQPEREVLENWATGFVDRDNKFVKEFQSTFESSMWELYIYAVLKDLKASLNFEYSRPDFNANISHVKFCIEGKRSKAPIYSLIN